LIVRSVSEPIVQGEPSFIEAARRKQIIECAIDAIAEVGFGGASLAEIAKRARISKGVISYYFDGKDDLIRQVVTAVYMEGGAFMLPRLAAATTARERLRAYITANVDFMATRRKYVIAVNEIVWAFRNADGSSKLDAGGLDLVQSDLETLLAWGQETGEFRAFSTDSMAFAIRAAIDMLPPLVSRGVEVDLQRYGEELADLFDRATTN
jgi:AcrR family transcriptional regulator